MTLYNYKYCMEMMIIQILSWMCWWKFLNKKATFFQFYFMPKSQKKLSYNFSLHCSILSHDEEKKAAEAAAIAFISHTRKKSERFLFIEKKNGTVFPFEGKLFFFLFLSFLLSNFHHLIVLTFFLQFQKYFVAIKFTLTDFTKIFYFIHLNYFTKL